MKQLLVALVIVAGFLAPARAETPTAIGITVENAWARTTHGGAKTGAIYLTLMNHGVDGDRLVGVATPVADRAQLHVESVENGIMTMRPLAEIEVKPGATAVLKLVASHVTLTGLKQPLKEGDTFPLTLDFTKAGKQEVPVTVATADPMSMPEGTMGAHDMSHVEMMKH